MLAPPSSFAHAVGQLRDWAMGRRAGRKRKEGARYKSGRLKPKPAEIDERTRVARSQPHRRELRSNDRTSEMAESALGRLTLRGALTPVERAAGETLAAIVGRYRAVIEGPRGMRSLMPDVAPERADSEQLESGSRFSCPSEHLDPIEHQARIGHVTVTTREWPCQLPGETCACRERRSRYTRAYEAIMLDAGRAAMLAVIRIAVRGEQPSSSEEIVNLRNGLRAAARHLGLTGLDRGS